MKGVIMPGVSAGSNQVGANETWTPHTIWPSGAASPVAGAPARATRRAAEMRTSARRTVMDTPPSDAELALPKSSWRRYCQMGRGRSNHALRASPLASHFLTSEAYDVYTSVSWSAHYPPGELRVW